MRSDENVARALQQTSAGYDLNPDSPLIPANNDEPASGPRRQQSKLWLEDWSERDKERLKHPQHWEGYIS